MSYSKVSTPMNTYLWWLSLSPSVLLNLHVEIGVFQIRPVCACVCECLCVYVQLIVALVVTSYIPFRMRTPDTRAVCCASVRVMLCITSYIHIYKHIHNASSYNLSVCMLHTHTNTDTCENLTGTRKGRNLFRHRDTHRVRRAASSRSPAIFGAHRNGSS
jgi:hypothetical protein